MCIILSRYEQEKEGENIVNKILKKAAWPTHPQPLVDLDLHLHEVLSEVCPLQPYINCFMQRLIVFCFLGFKIVFRTLIKGPEFFHVGGLKLDVSGQGGGGQSTMTALQIR